MKKTFPLKVLQINKTIFDDEATGVTVPGRLGELTVLAQHETMLSSLKKGKLSIMPSKGDTFSLDIEHGFIEATKDGVTILL